MRRYQCISTTPKGVFCCRCRESDTGGDSRMRTGAASPANQRLKRDFKQNCSGMLFSLHSSNAENMIIMIIRERPLSHILSTKEAHCAISKVLIDRQSNSVKVCPIVEGRTERGGKASNHSGAIGGCASWLQIVTPRI